MHITSLSIILSIIISLLSFLLLVQAAAARAQEQQTNMTRNGNITMSPGEGVLNGALIFKGKGYFATFTDPGIIIRIDLATLTREAAVTFDARLVQNLTANPAAGSVGLFRDGIEICGFAYFPCATNPGRFVKIDLAPVALATAPIRVVGIGSGLVDSEFSFVTPLSFGNNIYFGTKTSPARIVAFSTSTLQRLKSALLPANSGGVTAGVSQGRVAFFTLLGVNRGELVKFDLHTLTVMSHFSNSTSCCFNTMAASIPYGTFTADTSAAVSSGLFASASANVSSVNSGDALLFITTGTSKPGRIFKFNVSDHNLTKINSSSSSNNSALRLVDEHTSARYFWMVKSGIVGRSMFLVQTTDPGVLIRADIVGTRGENQYDRRHANSFRDFTNESLYSNISGLEKGEDFNIFATDGQFAFVGTNQNPARIIKFDLGLGPQQSVPFAGNSSLRYFPLPGNSLDNFGTGTLDLNRTVCPAMVLPVSAVDFGGTRVAQNFYMRLAPVTNLLEVRLFNSSVWGTVSSTFFTATTAAAVCRLLDGNLYGNVTWAPWFRAGASWHGLSSLLLSNNIFASQIEADALVANASSSNKSVRSSAGTRLKSLLKFPVYVDKLECPSIAVQSLDECTMDLQSNNNTDASVLQAVGLNCTAQDSEDGVYSGGYHFRLARNGRLDIREASSSSSASPTTTNTTSSTSSISKSWNAMCNRGFTQFTATGLCRILGYPFGTGYVISYPNGSADMGGTNGDSSNILLTGVECPATLNSFDDCSRLKGRPFVEACTRSDDVGLLCNGTRGEGTYVGSGMMMRVTREWRLEVKNLATFVPSPSSTGTIGMVTTTTIATTETASSAPSSSSGISYVANSDEDPTWATVCAHDQFSVVTAQAICNMLGFNISSYAAFAVSNNSEASTVVAAAAVAKPVGMTSLDCFDNPRPVFFGFCVFAKTAASGSQCSRHARDLLLMCEAETRGVRTGDTLFRLDTSNNNLVEARQMPSSSNASHWSSVCGSNNYADTNNSAAVSVSSSSPFSATGVTQLCNLMGFWGPKHSMSTSSFGGTGTLILGNFSCPATAPLSNTFSDGISSISNNCTFGWTETSTLVSSAAPHAIADDRCLSHRSDVELMCDAGSDADVDAGFITGMVLSAFFSMVVAALLVAGIVAGVLHCEADKTRKNNSNENDDNTMNSREAAEMNGVVVEDDVDEEVATRSPVRRIVAASEQQHHQQQQKQNSFVARSGRRPPPPMREGGNEGGVTATASATADSSSRGRGVVFVDESLSMVGRLRQQSDPAASSGLPRNWRQHPMYQHQAAAFDFYNSGQDYHHHRRGGGGIPSPDLESSAEQDGSDVDGAVARGSYGYQQQLQSFGTSGGSAAVEQEAMIRIVNNGSGGFVQQQPQQQQRTDDHSPSQQQLMRQRRYTGESSPRRNMMMMSPEQ